MKRFALALVCALTIGTLFFGVLPATAQDGAFQGVAFDPDGSIKKATNLPDEDVDTIVVRAIQWILGMLGLVSVIFVLYGGFVWMTAAGNEERITLAKKVIKSAIIGLIVILLSYAIVSFIFSRTIELTTPDDPDAAVPVP